MADRWTPSSTAVRDGERAARARALAREYASRSYVGPSNKRLERLQVAAHRYTEAYTKAGGTHGLAPRRGVYGPAQFGLPIPPKMSTSAKRTSLMGKLSAAGSSLSTWLKGQTSGKQGVGAAIAPGSRLAASTSGRLTSAKSASGGAGGGRSG